ncbi:hypothetical protein OIV83_000852 [Microbotryomycetes sp. JL201]|nr:hypothetical protein OIV83_000852 [Microbotryomycetes sp. JL201]
MSIADSERHEDISADSRRKRRSLIGSTIALGVESAAFSVGVAHAAYQLWQNPDPVTILDDDVDRHLKAREQKAVRRVANTAAAINQTTRPTPSLTVLSGDIQARASVRDRKHAKRRSLAVYTSSSPYIELVSGTDPFAHLRLPSKLAAFEPLEHHEEDQHEDDESRAADAEMDAMAERIRALIESGTKALVSTPILSPMATPPASPKPNHRIALHRRHSTQSAIRNPATPRTTTRSRESALSVIGPSPTKPSRHKIRTSIDSPSHDLKRECAQHKAERELGFDRFPVPVD